MKSCCFFGHSSMNYKPYAERIKSVITDLIENESVITFYSGGRGDFDCICRDIIYGLKKDYPHITSYLVLSYHPKTDSDINAANYDGTIYFLDRKVPLRFAISKTNEMMIDVSDFVISGVYYTWGGAYKSCEYARRKKKEIIRIIEEETI